MVSCALLAPQKGIGNYFGLELLECPKQLERT